MDRLTVAIFSYNRGTYLENCVASVRRNLPDVAIRVYDDNSSDPPTLAVLARLQLPVLQPGQHSGARHGGLYVNMAAALSDASTPLILFLQEDMQVVRPVGAADLDRIEAVFAENDRRAFVCPNFMKATSLGRYQARMVPNESLRAYLGRPDDPKRIAYLDVTVGHVGRLRDADWAFGPTEGAGSSRARAMFADVPYLGDPFTFYCPEVPIYRNRLQSLSSRIAARLTGTDVKAYHDLDGTETARLLARPLTDWPVAEDWLRPLNPRVRRPFVYKDVKVRWWLNLLNKAERWRKQ